MKQLQKIVIAGAVALTVVTSFAGTMTFPQSKSYGLKPTNANAA